MRPFDYRRAASLEEASARLDPGARIIAGGTNLLDLMKLQVMTPEALVDITRLPGLSEVEPTDDGGLRIGALVPNADLAVHPRVRAGWPLLARALLAGASGQLRNKATVGGNFLQRTRCQYFYDVFRACNKRVPGSGCDALDGLNRFHAILGASQHCIAVHPSDMAVAMAALDAAVETLKPDGSGRSIPVRSLHRLPGDDPGRDTVLEHGELITSVELPALPVAAHSTYRKVRDRASFEFALTSAAVALDLSGGRIRAAHVAAGGVGTVPWRLPAVERMLTGEIPSPQLFDTAAALATEGARPLSQNGFKIELLTRTVARQLGMVAGMR